jgi:hypothetical protein
MSKQGRQKEYESYEKEEREELFGFGGKKSKEHPRPTPQNRDVEKIKTELRTVVYQHPVDTQTLNELAKFLIGMISIIKTFPISNKIKMNRINFFATTR